MTRLSFSELVSSVKIFFTLLLLPYILKVSSDLFVDLLDMNNKDFKINIGHPRMREENSI